MSFTRWKYKNNLRMLFPNFVVGGYFYKLLIYCFPRGVGPPANRRRERAVRSGGAARCGRGASPRVPPRQSGRGDHGVQPHDRTGFLGVYGETRGRPRRGLRGVYGLRASSAPEKRRREEAGVGLEGAGGGTEESRLRGSGLRGYGLALWEVCIESDIRYTGWGSRVVGYK